MKILFNDAIRFLMEKTPSAPCPCCKTDRWVVPYGDEDKATAFLTPTLVSYGNEPAFNLALECRNCGFVRSHRAKFIADWIEQNPAPNPNE